MTKQIKINDRVVLSEQARATRDALAEIIDAMLCERQEKILDHENKIYRGRWNEGFQAKKQAQFDELVAAWSLFFSHLDEAFLMSKRQQDAASDSRYQTPEGAKVVKMWLESTMDRRLADMEEAEKAFLAAEAEAETDDKEKSFDEMTNEELAEFIVDERIRCGQWDEDERDYAIARELRGTREALVWSAERLSEWHAEEDAIEEDEMSDRPFNIDELYDFLGEFVEDYDIPGILDDATECDPITGNRFWKVSALDPEDFQRIVDEHEKTIHEETLETVADAIGTAFRSFRDQLAADASVEEDDDDWYMSDRKSPTEAECEYEKLAEQVGGQISFPFPLTISEETRAEYPDFTQVLPDVFFHLDPDDDGDRADYEQILREVGQKCLFDDCDACMSMSEDEKRALALLNEIWAYDDDEDGAEDFEDAWTEWLVLCGEQEELVFDEDCAPAWVWVPTRRNEVAGVDHPFLSRDDAIKVFDDTDPFVMWMGRRLDEVASGRKMELDRRFEVELVCQNVNRTADGLESVRDDSVSMSKSFDITHDGKAKRLLKNLFA